MAADLNQIAQEYSDLLNIIQADNAEIASKIPVMEAQKMLIEDPENIEAAFAFIRAWIDQNWVPVILEQSTEVQKMAIETAGQW